MPLILVLMTLEVMTFDLAGPNKLPPCRALLSAPEGSPYLCYLTPPPLPPTLIALILSSYFQPLTAEVMSSPTLPPCSALLLADLTQQSHPPTLIVCCPSFIRQLKTKTELVCFQ